MFERTRSVCLERQNHIRFVSSKTTDGLLPATVELRVVEGRTDRIVSGIKSDESFIGTHNLMCLTPKRKITPLFSFLVVSLLS